MTTYRHGLNYTASLPPLPLRTPAFHMLSMHTARVSPRHTRLSRALFAVWLCTATTGTSLASTTDADLPTFVGHGGGLLSSQMEAQIGADVLRWLQSSAKLLNDPLLYEYLHSIIYRLVPNTPLEQRELRLIIIDDPSINAFAVPGGLIGINGGLLVHARTEQQFASVIAHELAHLSQRHFARRLEQQSVSAPLTLAGMIAGVILSAATGSDAGIAAIAGTQALAAQNALTYSRAHEQEADRIGLEIMASSGLDPRGMPSMFEQMVRQSRLYGNRLPEYLSTHPLSESRVSDTRNRAEQYPVRNVEDSAEYHLMRVRMLVHYAESPALALKQLESMQENELHRHHPAAQYGLAVAQLSNQQPQKALELLDGLLERHPGRISFVVTRAQALEALDRKQEGIDSLRTALERNPDNYPLTRTLAMMTLGSDQNSLAVRLFDRLSRTYPYDPALWLRLAEAQGHARNIVEVHRARAEYLLLMGDAEGAVRQLTEALDKSGSNLPLYEVIRVRLDEARALEREKRR